LKDSKSAKSGAQRQARRRERLRGEGVNDWTVTAHRDDIEEIRRYAKELLDRRGLTKQAPSGSS
jgi:hypothetical protein